MKDPWRLLGVSSHSNTNMIRKAYAEKIKQCHPEEHPEEFKQLNEAYRQAIADASRKPGFFYDGIPETDTCEPQAAEYHFNRSPEEAISEDKVPQNSSFNYSDFKTRPESKDPGVTSSDVLKKIQVFITIGEARRDIWRTFFSSDRFIRVMNEPAFIGEITELLRKYRTAFQPAIFRMIKRQYFQDKRNNPRLPPYRQLAQALKEQLGFKRCLYDCISFVVKHIWLILLILIFASLGLSYLVQKSHSHNTVSNADTLPNSIILENVETYLTNEYPAMDITVFESLIEDNAVHSYECTLPEYNNLTFKAYARPPYDLSSIKDNLFVSVCS